MEKYIVDDPMGRSDAGSEYAKGTGVALATVGGGIIAGFATAAFTIAGIGASIAGYDDLTLNLQAGCIGSLVVFNYCCKKGLDILNVGEEIQTDNFPSPTP